MLFWAHVRRALTISSHQISNKHKNNNRLHVYNDIYWWYHQMIWFCYWNLQLVWSHAQKLRVFQMCIWQQSSVIPHAITRASKSLVNERQSWGSLCTTRWQDGSILSNNARNSHALLSYCSAMYHLFNQLSSHYCYYCYCCLIRAEGNQIWPPYVGEHPESRCTVQELGRPL